jgi:uncharacterized protein (TIGR00369 family)
MSVVKSPPAGFELLLPNNPYWEQFGPVYADRSTLRLGFRIEEHHCNPVKSLHGGALATFADMQLMALPQYDGELETHAPTISLSLDYIGPAYLGEWVEADVVVDRTTRRLLFIRSLITADGRTIARSNILYRNHDKTGYPLT